ncbi:MAG TPA: hypothetical protein VEK80_00120 [Kribbellaceae bacterium]|nr:hypothetical protein [Kribbellaceae bacterium]
MSLVLLAVLAAVAGWRSRSWWLLALPPAAGLVALLWLSTGAFATDNPVLFLVALLEAASAAGIVAGRHAARVRPDRV